MKIALGHQIIFQRSIFGLKQQTSNLGMRVAVWHRVYAEGVHLIWGRTGRKVVNQGRADEQCRAFVRVKALTLSREFTS